jgi:phage gp36-like protein
VPYCTKPNLLKRFGEEELIQRTDRGVPGLGVIDDAVLTLAMARADAYADGQLRSRYAVPIAAPTLDLLTQVENKARRYLYDDGMTEAVKDGDDEATLWFKEVAAGRVTLDAPLAPSTALGAVGEAMFAQSVNAFEQEY